MRFYSFVNWYFSGLSEKFQHTYVDPKRTLYVYSDLAQTQIVGGRETDLLSFRTDSQTIRQWTSLRSHSVLGWNERSEQVPRCGERDECGRDVRIPIRSQNHMETRRHPMSIPRTASR